VGIGERKRRSNVDTSVEIVMLIKETVERECCQEKDLKKYKGCLPNSDNCFFCIHCGQLWSEESYMDEAGARDTRMVKCK